MSGKLDQSLDEIVSTHRRGAGRGGRGARKSTRPARNAAGPAAPVAPVGGIKKNTKARGGAKVPTGPSGAVRGDSKILISNLPKDVNEAQIKEYLIQAVGPVKRVELAYGPNGQSRGVATVTFVHQGAANEAGKKLKDILIDGKAMKIDIIVDAQRAANLPAPKGLSDRITAPKAQPKSAVSKPKAEPAAGRGGRGKGRGRGGRTNAPKKTTEEMDSEMADYWTAGATEGAAAAPAATNGGDAPMEDEIL